MDALWVYTYWHDIMHWTVLSSYMHRYVQMCICAWIPKDDARRLTVSFFDIYTNGWIYIHTCINISQTPDRFILRHVYKWMNIHTYVHKHITDTWSFRSEQCARCWSHQVHIYMFEYSFTHMFYSATNMFCCQPVDWAIVCIWMLQPSGAYLYVRIFCQVNLLSFSLFECVTYYVIEDNVPHSNMWDVICDTW
jgi:hypothetical protein